MKSRLKGRRLAVFAAGAAAVLAAAGIASASIPSSGGVLTACVNGAGALSPLT
jgi:hypothetical protein